MADVMLGLHHACALSWKNAGWDFNVNILAQAYALAKEINILSDYRSFPENARRVDSRWSCQPGLWTSGPLLSP